MSIRLNKLLAERGIGARRKCDALIESGSVRVNGVVVREPGTAVEPDRDRVEVNGRALPPRAAPGYFVLHKPVGVISTLSDPEGRRTLVEFLPPGRRVFPVGRLDADTSGLLILTSDGELAHHLMHPRYGVTKLYRVHADRAPSPEMLRRLREGIEFEPGVRSAPARVRVRDTGPGESVIELELHEGRYRQVRRMIEAAGLRVLRLHRWGYGPLRLAGLERGLWRELSLEEVRRLRSASARAHPRPAGLGPMRPRSRPRGEMQATRFERGGDAESRPRGETRARRFERGGDAESRPRGESRPQRFGGSGDARWRPRGDAPRRPFAPDGEASRHSRGEAPRRRFPPDREAGRRSRSEAPRGRFRSGGDAARRSRGGAPQRPGAEQVPFSKYRPRAGGQAGERPGSRNRGSARRGRSAGAPSGRPSRPSGARRGRPERRGRGRSRPS